MLQVATIGHSFLLADNIILKNDSSTLKFEESFFIFMLSYNLIFCGMDFSLKSQKDFKFNV